MYANKKVLLVDDLPFNLQALTILMEKIGFSKNNFIFAKNGSEALGVLHSVTIDIVITDYQMPVMDGLALLKEIKNDTRLNKIPVILNYVTATRELIYQAIKLGATGFFPKPYDENKIAVEIEKAFPS